MSTFLKVIGTLFVIWIGFMVLGFVFHALFVLAIIGVVAALGTAAVGAIRSRKRNQLYR
jgi:hypothetical protein